MAYNSQATPYGENHIGSVSIDSATLPLPTGAATETTLSAINGKLINGTDIGDVTINNANGASAVNIQDGGNTITVDGTVGVSGSVAVTGTFYQATQPVSFTGSTDVATQTTLSAINTKLVAGTTIGSVEMKAYRSSDSSYQPLRLDKATNSLQIIDYPHHEIHAGSYFHATWYASGKNDGTTINLYFKTPATTPYVHAFFKWSASGQAYAYILEAPTVTDNTGTNGQIPVNHNRNSATTSGVYDNATTPVVNRWGYDVTISNNGTEIWRDFSGAAKTSSGGGRNEDEFILKANTEYCFVVESDAAGLVLWGQVLWYEHTDIA